MLSGPAAAAINHLLQDAEWARAHLGPFSGSTILFKVPPLSVAVTVENDGRLVAASSQAEPAAVVRLTGPALIRLVWLRDEAARQEVRVTGDTALASALTGILSALHWDVEEDLSRVLGDVIAHRLTRTGSALLAWHAGAASNLAQSLAEYWTEEQPLVASRAAVREFVHAVDALRDDVARLEKRVERLTPRTDT
jgi:ubiquinone biosynthesis accessory factor UbiJ